LENWKKLLEEANGELEEKIRSLFLRSEDYARRRERTERGGGVIGSKGRFFVLGENSREGGKNEKNE
jgi:hypothetical protein